MLITPTTTTTTMAMATEFVRFFFIILFHCMWVKQSVSPMYTRCVNTSSWALFSCRCARATFAATGSVVDAAVDNKKMNVPHLTCHFIVRAFFLSLHFHCLPLCIILCAMAGGCMPCSCVCVWLRLRSALNEITKRFDSPISSQQQAEHEESKKTIKKNSII